jgi:hypothetical protein
MPCQGSQANPGGFVSKLVVVVLDSVEIFFAMKQFFYL